MMASVLHDTAALNSDVRLRKTAAIQPHLLVFDPSQDRAAGLVEELRARGVQLDVTILAPHLEQEVVARECIDVAAINLAGAAPNGLVFAAELSAQMPSVQCVFWFDGDKLSPGEDAARSLGVQRILPRARLVDWLGLALEPLARIARAKRQQAEAEADLPRIPDPELDRVSAPMPLPEAERSFRESYLRALMAQATNARIAAQQAGVPYTTLCSMLKKLGLEKALRAKGR